MNIHFVQILLMNETGQSIQKESIARAWQGKPH
jgi:hypothetical protein